MNQESNSGVNRCQCVCFSCHLSSRGSNIFSLFSAKMFHDGQILMGKRSPLTPYKGACLHQTAPPHPPILGCSETQCPRFGAHPEYV